MTEHFDSRRFDRGGARYIWTGSQWLQDPPAAVDDRATFLAQGSPAASRVNDPIDPVEALATDDPLPITHAALSSFNKSMIWVFVINSVLVLLSLLTFAILAACGNALGIIPR